MLKTISLAIVLFLFFSVSAQEHRTCGTMNSQEYLYAKDSTYRAQMVLNEVAINDWIKKHGDQRQKAIITIPVVVHIIYQFQVQNISDAQIQSQIDILNDDYRRMNADAALTPDTFKSVAADIQIEFCYAHQDPAGNWTNGVTRTQTTKSKFEMSTNEAKFTSLGGHDAWDRDKYFNIWVVPSIVDGPDAGILGYSQFPGGPAATDGVVIAYRYFGNTGTATYPYNKGRTLTHELGHWLSLYHIWGDDNGSCSGSDKVMDTPNQADYNYNCPQFPHSSCNNYSDMFMNYMDYTDDACMNMFTQGQKQRMMAVMNTNRASLKTSNVCQIVSFDQPNIEERMKVYPNPSEGVFMLDFNEIELKGKVEITIFNALGQLIYAKSYQNIGNIEQINISNSHAGIYMLHVNSEYFNIIRKIEIHR